jgi:hypothetical protein
MQIYRDIFGKDEMKTHLSNGEEFMVKENKLNMKKNE